MTSKEIYKEELIKIYEDYQMRKNDYTFAEITNALVNGYEVEE